MKLKKRFFFLRIKYALLRPCPATVQANVLSSLVTLLPLWLSRRSAINNKNVNSQRLLLTHFLIRDQHTAFFYLFLSHMHIKTLMQKNIAVYGEWWWGRCLQYLLLLLWWGRKEQAKPDAVIRCSSSRQQGLVGWSRGGVVGYAHRRLWCCVCLLLLCS